MEAKMTAYLPRPDSISLQAFFPQGSFPRGDFAARRVQVNPQAVEPGDIFLARTTASGDTHDQVPDALARGARGVIAERMLPWPALQCVVADTREAYGRLAHALAGEPARKLRLIGVTGSHGKTSTSVLLAAVLRAAGTRVGLLSSLGCSVAGTASTGVKPKDAAELAAVLSNMVESRCETAIVEASSTALAERRYSGLEFDLALVTNLRREHATTHGSVANYHAAMQRLVDALHPAGVAILNADDRASADLLDRLQHPALTVSQQGAGEINAVLYERALSEQTFMLQAGEDTAVVRSRITGDGHIANCLSAAAAALTLGIDLPTIVRGLESVESIPGRLERIECGQSFGVFVDSAASPDALTLTLRGLRAQTPGRLICVMGCRGMRAKEDRSRIGRVLEKCAHEAVLTSDDPRSENPLAIIHDMLDGYDKPHRARALPRPGRGDPLGDQHGGTRRLRPHCRTRPPLAAPTCRSASGV
jgi:UDP-N-acetylmuramoyl-L-alanyl-D-glutamate--2,6-diaminopimelate ligase